MSLWKKESNCVDALFVNLFTPNRRTFAEWDRQIQANDWKHKFLLYSIKPKKNNKVSDSFRFDGTNYFNCAQWMEAMELYTQSLRFAETETDNVCFAYANRSNCFLKMKEYEKCLIDIDLAIKANYPARLMPKLEKRKAECEELMKKHQKPNPFEPKLSFVADKMFPCMANVLEIQRNDEFGRHIVAKCDIDVGQTILVEENFVSAAAGIDRANCFTCLSTEKNFMACSNCTDVLFCSEDCRDRNGVHQKFCGATILRMPNAVKYYANSILIALNAFPDVNELMRFVADVLSKRAIEIPKAANDIQSKYGLFLSLQPAKIAELDIETVYKVYAGLMNVPLIKRMFDTEASRRFLMHLVAEHSLIISQNCYGNPSSVITTGCVMSLFNHACAPNVFNSTANNREVCITMRPIKKGQQLFVKYLCGERTTRERQVILLKRWGFLCKCDKCMYGRIPMHAPLMFYPNYSKMYGECRMFQYFADKSGLKEKCEAYLRNFGHLQWQEQIGDILTMYTQCLLDPFPNA